MILWCGVKIDLIWVLDDDGPGRGFGVTQSGGEGLHRQGKDHSRICHRHCGKMRHFTSGMVIFIICYFNVHENFKQVLIDWGQRCPSSDDTSVASHFPYLIPLATVIGAHAV